MTKTELLALLAVNRASSGVEYKRDDIKPEHLAKELVAFTNLDGGVVVLGVEDNDDRSVSGLVREDVEEWVMNVCRDKVRPPIIPWFQVLEDVEPGKNVAIVRVSPGYAVHARVHNNAQTYYIRVGSTSREASQEELARLFQQRGSMRAELQPVSGTTWEALDVRRLQDYFGSVRGQLPPTSEEADQWITLLINTELLDEGTRAVTVGGLLLFGRNPRRWLPHTGVDAVAYPGTEPDYASIERAEISGPLTALSSEGEDGQRVLVENGTVEEALAFVRRNVPVSASLESGRRHDAPALPEEPIREAVVNALVHRDWLLTSSNVQLSIFSDRLEVTSPGRLPNGITPDRMRAGTRAARNQLLKDVMRDYHYLEHMGMGVSRKIVAGMRRFNDTDPDLVEDGERFTVVLRRTR